MHVLASSAAPTNQILTGRIWATTMSLETDKLPQTVLPAAQEQAAPVLQQYEAPFLVNEKKQVVINERVVAIM